MARKAASSTASGAPTKVSTVRLWSRSEERSSRRAPSTELMAATIWSMTSGRRASEKLGIHSMSWGMGGSILDFGYFDRFASDDGNYKGVRRKMKEEKTEIGNW